MKAYSQKRATIGLILSLSLVLLLLAVEPIHAKCDALLGRQGLERGVDPL